MNVFHSIMQNSIIHPKLLCICFLQYLFILVRQWINFFRFHKSGSLFPLIKLFCRWCRNDDALHCIKL